MNQRDLQRWTREVAQDPGAPSFVRLARAYRRQGRRDAARDVVLRGLERRPEHVDAHGLLAVLHVEAGDREQARDEWETVLTLDPDNFEAGRGLGFLALEREDFPAARRHLEAAARARPDDPAVRQAMEVLERRERAPARRTGEPSGGPARDPRRLFDSLARESVFLGGLVLDARGLVLAGALELEGDGADYLAGVLTAAAAEARRVTAVLELGEWDGMLVDSEAALVHLGGLESGAMVVVAARRDAPAGWVVRTAGRARTLATRFLEDDR